MFEKFTNRYAVSKTLRFELKPVGKTRENIERSGILLTFPVFTILRVACICDKMV